MPFIDLEAAATVRELRERRGLSPEALAERISAKAAAEGWDVGTIHAYTIRRIEGNPAKGIGGRVPGIRVQCVIGLYFGVDHREIWKDSRRMYVPADPPAVERQRVTA